MVAIRNALAVAIALVVFIQINAHHSADDRTKWKKFYDNFVHTIFSNVDWTDHSNITYDNIIKNITNRRLNRTRDYDPYAHFDLVKMYNDYAEHVHKLIVENKIPLFDQNRKRQAAIIKAINETVQGNKTLRKIAAFLDKVHDYIIDPDKVRAFKVSENRFNNSTWMRNFIDPTPR